MYIDTSGINKTKPIEGLERLTDKAFMVKTEALSTPQIKILL